MSTALTLPTHPTHRHPRTGLALRAIGFHPRTGLPLWPIIGAAADDWSSVFEGKTPTEVKEALEAAQEAAQKAGSGDPSPWDDLFKDQKPEDVKEALENSRKWETRAKGNKAKADQFDELVKKITGKDDDTDPEKLAQDLTAAQRDARATKVEVAVLKSASKHDADPALLADSRSFMDSIADLDPADDDFKSKLDAAIKKAVEDNAALKVTSATGPRPVRQQGKPSQGRQGGVQAGAERYKERRQRSSTTTS
jgi:hypothetical protein